LLPDYWLDFIFIGQGRVAENKRWGTAQNGLACFAPANAPSK
jgi:hypothetical protein